MHSRKPRLNDSYYDTPNRSFQNSKYNSSRYSNNYYRDRDSSPKRAAHRSVSPEGSPRDRYHQSSSYRNKDREREHKKDKYSDKRGRDREIEYKTYNKKAKTRERSSSEDDHKDADRLYDKARYGDRDSLRRGLPEKERRFGDWKEMISKGSGKKYYYNERDKSSQWEKPEEWPEYDQSYSASRGYREKERDRKNRDDRYNNTSSRRSFCSSKHSRGNSRARWPHDSFGVQTSTSSSLGHHKRHDDHPDMDISPDSTPTSEPSYSSPTATNQHINSSNINSNSLNHDDLPVASPNGHALHIPANSNSQMQHQISHVDRISSSRQLSNSNKNSTIASSSSPSTHNYATYHSSQHHRHRSMSPSENSSAHHNNIGSQQHELNNMHHSSNNLRSSPVHGTSNNMTSTVQSSRVELSNSNHPIGEGPPTPEMDLNSPGDHRRSDGATGVSSLQSVIGSASQISNRLNLLTPSLAKFFRADLIQHVTNWPSETFEKQTQKCAEDVYLLGDLDCSRISAEIQCARSIVRVAEIAATIQGQRRLFLQEQIKSLEDSQTQNSSTISY